MLPYLLGWDQLSCDDAGWAGQAAAALARAVHSLARAVHSFFLHSFFLHRFFLHSLFLHSFFRGTFARSLLLAPNLRELSREDLLLPLFHANEDPLPLSSVFIFRFLLSCRAASED